MRWRKTLKGWELETIKLKTINSTINAKTEETNDGSILTLKFAWLPVKTSKHSDCLRAKQAAKRAVDKLVISSIKEFLNITEEYLDDTDGED